MLADFPLTIIFAAEHIAFTFVSLFKEQNRYTISRECEVFIRKIIGLEEGLLPVIKSYLYE